MSGRRVIVALVVGAAAAVCGGVVGAVLTRGLMRLIALVAGADPSFSWAGLAFIALFYVLFLAPGAVALAWSRSRWSLGLLGLGAVAIPVQATGIALTDLEAVGPLSAGQWAVLALLFLAMAAVYAVQAVLVHRLATAGRPARAEEPGEALAGAGGGRSPG